MKTLLNRFLCWLGLHDDAFDHDAGSSVVYACSRCGTVHYRGRGILP